MTAQAGIEVDGARVAALLGLAEDDFRRLMAANRIAVLCERGTGDDAGRWRATFYYGERRARLLLDSDGRILDGEA